MRPCVMIDNPRVILIVDDDENDSLFLSRALHEIAPELSTHTVNGGAEAMAYLEGDAEFLIEKNSLSPPSSFST